MIIRKKMDRTNTLIIFASVTLATFLIANTTTMINAFEDKEFSYYLEDSMEHNPEIYDEYYDSYESGYYEDRYGKPYYIE